MQATREPRQRVVVGGNRIVKRRPLIRGQRHGLVLLVFAVAVFAVYAASPVIQSGDSRLVVYQSDSLIRHGDLDVREYGPIVHDWPCYREGDRIISRYPWGTAAVSAPFLAVFEAGARFTGSNAVADLSTKQPRGLEKTTASAIAALAALAMVLLTLEMTGRLAPALAAGAVFALGTSLWSTASRGLWQHGPMVLFMTLALVCLLRGRRLGDPRWSALAGLLLGIAFVVRPTAAVTIGVAGLVLLISDRKALVGFTTGVSTVVLPSIAVNLSIYGTVIAPIYLPGEGPANSGLSTTLGQGLAGTMVSPGRGLFIFSPFLVLAFVGLWLRRRSLNRLDVVAIGSILGLWFSVANSGTWEGGASFGPRLLTETLPFWAYLIAPVFGLVVRPLRAWTPAVTAVAVVLGLTVAFSILVHGRGAVSWSTQLWNSQPRPLDHDRLFGWTDLQFFRGGHATYDDLYPHRGLPAVQPDELCIYPAPPQEQTTADPTRAAATNLITNPSTAVRFETRRQSPEAVGFKPR